MKRIMVKLLGALVIGTLLNLQIDTVLAQGAAIIALTITDPIPADGDCFGRSVAALGPDRILIGAYQDDIGTSRAGAAYLLGTNGVVLTTFTNPTPASYDNFGYSVATVGTDQVLIGAYQGDMGANNAGAAYLFSTNGALLTTFANPTPAAGDNFGYAVAAVGIDRVLIGAHQDDTGWNNMGEAYLFSTSGALLNTFTNPHVGSDWFGYAVAALGTDQVLIGAAYGDTGAFEAGAAYLFSTNGTLLTTFTNPTPAYHDAFGWSVAALGTDRVLIGSPGDETGAGAAYLFNTNGVLLATFTNLTRMTYDYFGSSVAAVGTDYVLIGAYGKDSGFTATDTGAAYLFSTNGTLLNTFTNPTPETTDWFGISVAAVGTDLVLIGAYGDNTGGSDAGSAYLFSTALQTPEAPTLNIRLTTTNTVVVTWPAPSAGWTLQESTNGVSSVNWSNASGTIQDDGATRTLIINPPTGSRFYRLSKP